MALLSLITLFVTAHDTRMLLSAPPLEHREPENGVAGDVPLAVGVLGQRAIRGAAELWPHW